MTAKTGAESWVRKARFTSRLPIPAASVAGVDKFSEQLVAFAARGIFQDSLHLSLIHLTELARSSRGLRQQVDKDQHDLVEALLALFASRRLEAGLPEKHYDPGQSLRPAALKLYAIAIADCLAISVVQERLQ